MRRLNSERGFTLVELLIVIVIIGILAGVVIGVLNPVQQQNRARDGVLRSSLSKVALGAKSLAASSTNGSVPTPLEFVGTVGNVGTNDCTATTFPSGCNALITGISMPTDCSTDAYSGGGTDTCNIRYYAASANAFRILVKNFANPRGMIVYDYVQTPGTGAIAESFYNCPVTFAQTTAIGGCTRYNQ